MTAGSWPEERRFLAVVVLAAYARKRMEDDGAAYGAPGVPNLTSIRHAVSAPPEALDACLDELRSMAAVVSLEFP